MFIRDLCYQGFCINRFHVKEVPLYKQGISSIFMNLVFPIQISKTLDDLRCYLHIGILVTPQCSEDMADAVQVAAETRLRISFLLTQRQIVKLLN